MSSNETGAGSVEGATSETSTVAGETSQASQAGQDRAVILGRVPGGPDDRLAIVRRRNEQAPLEFGVVEPLREGKPLHGEVVQLTPTANQDVTNNGPILCDVKVQYAGPNPAKPALSANRAPAELSAGRTQKGPAKVASEPYREGWERIFQGTTSSTKKECN